MSMRFRLFKLPVEVNPSFFLVTLLIARPRGLETDELLRVGLWMAVVFFSILWHELGHALVMRAFGRSPHIELYALGGLAHWGHGPEPTVWRRIVVSLAGPGAGLVLGAAALVISHVIAPSPGTAWATFASFVIWVNLVWGALNLIPMLPLDGGKVMQAVLDLVIKGRGEVAAEYVSIGVSAIVAFLAYRANWPWVAVLAAWSGVSTITRLLRARAEARDAPLWERLDEAWKLLGAGQKERGMEITEEVLFAAKSDRVRAVAVEQLAWQWLLDGDVERAKAQLTVAPASTRPSTILRGAIALRSGDAKEASVLLEKVVEKEPEPASVHLLIEAYLSLGRLDAAVALLEDEKLNDLVPEDVRMMVESERSKAREGTRADGAS